jgi:hypothetical protein
MSWQRPNIGSRVTREGHARFWERLEVKFLRATRQKQMPNEVRSDGSFPRKRSPAAGDGCAADHCSPGLLLVAEPAPTVDATHAGHGTGYGPEPVVA